VYAEDSTKVFLTVELTHALTYGYGMKGHCRGLFRLLDRLCREGGADDNMCDMPRTTDSDMIPLVQSRTIS
jgi:hypothetical protein